MSDPFEPNEDATLHEVLRQLPPLKAPDSLAPRVMQAIAMRQARLAWWRQPAQDWPLPARAALIVVSLSLVIAVFRWLESNLNPLSPLNSASSPTHDLWSAFDTVRNLARVMTEACLSLLRALPTAMGWMFGASIIAAYTACMSVGGWVYRQWAAQGQEQ